MTGRLVVGVGAGRGVRTADVLALVTGALRDAGLDPADVGALATAAPRAAEPGLAGAAARLGVRLLAFPVAELARVAVPHPSETVRGALGTPSVAEAAALAGAGAGGRLLVPKRVSAPGTGPRATVAVARGH